MATTHPVDLPARGRSWWQTPHQTRQQPTLLVVTLTLLARALPTRTGSLINASQGLRGIRADQRARAEAAELLAVPPQRGRGGESLGSGEGGRGATP